MTIASVIGSVRVRAALSLGLVLGLGTVGTLAAWSTTAQTTSGTFTTGTVDIKFDDGTTLGNQGKPTPFAVPLQAGDLLPGQSKAGIMKVVNGGNLRFTYTGVVSTVTTGPAYTSRFTAGTPNAAGVCSGTEFALTTPRAVTVGSTDNVCVQVTLDALAPNTDQGKQGTVVIALSAEAASV